MKSQTKRQFLLFAFASLSLNLVQAQSDPNVEIPKKTAIFYVVDEAPEFPGGEPAMEAYLKKHTVLPEKVKSGAVYGKVYLRFVISENGNISNVVVQRGIADCPECDAEAVRVTKAMPHWKPGKLDGKPVNIWYTIPVRFSNN